MMPTSGAEQKQFKFWDETFAFPMIKLGENGKPVTRAGTPLGDPLGSAPSDRRPHRL